MNECFEGYIGTLNDLKLLENEGQEQASCAIEELKNFIKDNRICAPDALLSITDNKITIKTSEKYSTVRLVEIEEFTGFSLKYKDDSKLIFEYEG